MAVPGCGLLNGSIGLGCEDHSYPPILLSDASQGFPFAYGVFQDYYSTHEPFAGSKDITIIGTCAMVSAKNGLGCQALADRRKGIMYLSAPLVFAMLQRWPRLQKWSTPVGLTAMCLGLLLSSFASNIAQLIATQGVIYAVGGALAYSPCILFMDQWFVKRKGLAYGVMWAGTGLAGVVLPSVVRDRPSPSSYADISLESSCSGCSQLMDIGQPYVLGLSSSAS